MAHFSNFKQTRKDTKKFRKYQNVLKNRKKASAVLRGIEPIRAAESRRLHAAHALEGQEDQLVGLVGLPGHAGHGLRRL